MFESIVTADRWAYVRHLQADLPTSKVPMRDIKSEFYEPEDPREPVVIGFETYQDRLKNTEASTALLKRLWLCLEKLGSQDKDATVSFQLGNDDAERTVLLRDGGIEATQHEFLFQDLTRDIVDFPTLHCVREFHVYTESRAWNPWVAAILAAKMPNMEASDWLLDHASRTWGRFYTVDALYREGLLKGAAAVTLPASLERFSCHLKIPWYDRVQSLPEFIKEGAQDPLSHALHRLTRNCTEIELKGSFMPCLFDPLPLASATDTRVEGEPGEAGQHWQRLKVLRVELNNVRPDGLCYVQIGDAKDVDTGSGPLFHVLPSEFTDCGGDASHGVFPPGYSDSPDDTFRACVFIDYKREVILPPPPSELGRWKIWGYDRDSNDESEDENEDGDENGDEDREEDEDDDMDESERRCLLRSLNDRFPHLLLAFARCCSRQRMPALEVAFLELNTGRCMFVEEDSDFCGYHARALSGYECPEGFCVRQPSRLFGDLTGHMFEIMCVSAGHNIQGWSIDDDNDWTRTRVYLHCRGWKWRDNSPLLKALENIGVDRDGVPAIVQIVPWGECYHLEGDDEDIRKRGDPKARKVPGYR
ncbi:hypothetical protein F5Y17DRAFT_413120 [Xylariaceae sp. FL0594]|nr:hypothetical protein F5Y17DRAFT_413120 [Xylariaceae sp. FL0594]